MTSIRLIKRLTRPIRHVLFLLLVKSVWFSSFFLSERFWLLLGAQLGEVFGRLHPKRKVLGQYLKLAELPQSSERLIWRDLGLRVFESFRLARTAKRIELTPRALEHLNVIKRRESGVLLLCPHFGHWEAMGKHLSEELAFEVVPTQGKRDRINRFIQRRRNENGIKVIDTGFTARDVVKALSKEGCIVLFMDVPAKRRPRSIFFLGRSVERSTVPERLVAMTSVPAYLVYNYRDSRGQYVVDAHLIPSDADVMRWSHEHLESLVRRYPSQWIWFLD